MPTRTRAQAPRGTRRVARWGLLWAALLAWSEAANSVPSRRAFDRATFDYFSAQWREHHRSWIAIDQHLSLCDPSRFRSSFPVCLDGWVIPEPQAYISNNTELCPQVTCLPAVGGCVATPSDTIDYFPPSIDSSLDNSTICAYQGPDAWVAQSTLSLDAGIPPLYTPLVPVRMQIQGRVLSMSPTQCLPVEGAEIIAWQVSPAKMDLVSLDLPAGSAAQTQSSLRDRSCSAMQHSDNNGNYSFRTLMPPSYGPPRHISFKVSAPGYQPLITRVYFDADWRLQQLTTLGGEEESRFIDSMAELVRRGTNSSRQAFPGAIATDPRVAALSFVEETVASGGKVKGYFFAAFDFVLSPLRVPAAHDVSPTPPFDLSGIWVEPHSGKVLVETHGSFFHAKEVPHPRKWGSVSGYLVGNTVRGVTFSSPHGTVDSTDNGRLTTSVLAASTSYSTGVFVPADPFSSGPFLATSPAESSIAWSGGTYAALWTRLERALAPGYRFVKLVVTRETGGHVGGSLVINEIAFFEGAFAQTEQPTRAMKMRTPRYPAPQIVACSSFIDQEHHCFRAFDGDSSANSSWVTRPVSSRREVLAEPQWVVLDLGAGRGVLPTAVRIVCDTAGALESYARGCPRTFSVLVSADNVRYDPVFTQDFREYRQDYRLGGNMFYFGADMVQGRIQGQRCGSCEVGPSFACHLGAYDGSCNSRFCGPEGTCTLPLDCPAGRFLAVQFESFSSPTFHCALCPAGRYGDRPGLHDARCSGVCAPGYFCPEGSLASTALSCGGAHVFCPAGSASPILAPSGRKTVRIAPGGLEPAADTSTQTDTVPCSPGHYCSNGLELPCPVGTFGDVDSLGSAACSGSCRAGSFCPESTVSPLPCSPGHYCPDGHASLPCPAGRFGASSGLKDMACSGPCAPGFFCLTGSASAQSERCPPGRYGDRPGLTNSSCSGACSEGFFCPPASISAEQRPCGGSSVFCPEGSTMPTPVSPGYYTAGGEAASSRPLQIAAERGFFALEGVRHPCPAGSFGNASGLSADDVQVPVWTPCPSTSPTLSPSARPSRAPSLAPSVQPSLAPSASPTIAPTASPSVTCSPTRAPSASVPPTWSPTMAPTTAPTARPSVPPTPSPSAAPSAFPSYTFYPTSQPSDSPSSQPSGQPSMSPSQLLQHTSIPSAAPTLEGEYVRTNFVCSGLCLPGYFCPLNSTSPTQRPCPAGRFGASAGLTDSRCTAECPLGHYCPAASAQPLPCPAGVFGNRTALQDATCSPLCVDSVGCDRTSNLCAAGYFCPQGSVSAQQIQCGGPDRFCPRGSPQPTPVGEGHYSVGGDGFTRADQRLCEHGHFCVGGLRFPCPAGRYGSTMGLASPACSGSCPAGHYCPEGTVFGITFRCPAGTYGEAEGLQNSACSGPCAAGFHCPEASVASAQLPCAVMAREVVTDPARWSQVVDGSIEPFPAAAALSTVYLDAFDKQMQKAGPGLILHTLLKPSSVYCPVGSARPLVALPGYYTVGQNATTRVDQTPCTKGSYCIDGIRSACPAGFYGARDREVSHQCSGKCAKGYYCLPGSTVLRQFPCPAGRYGSQEGLTSAQCSGSCSKPLECPPGSVAKR